LALNRAAPCLTHALTGSEDDVRFAFYGRIKTIDRKSISVRY